jgi:hypothetical protein
MLYMHVDKDSALQHVMQCSDGGRSPVLITHSKKCSRSTVSTFNIQSRTINVAWSTTVVSYSSQPEASIKAELCIARRCHNCHW